MKNIIPISKARQEIFSIAERAQKSGQHFILTEGGYPKVVILSASDFESLLETVEVLKNFPDLEEEILEAEAGLHQGTVRSLDEVLAAEGYTKISKGGKKHELQSRSASRRGRGAR